MRILTAGISVLEREKFKDRSYDFDKADKNMYEHKRKVKEKNYGESFGRLVQEYKCFKSSHL